MSKKTRALAQYVIDGEPMHYHVTIELLSEERREIALKIEYNADDYKDDDKLMQPLYNYLSRLYSQYDKDENTIKDASLAQIILTLVDCKPSPWYTIEKWTLKDCQPISVNFGELSYSIPMVELEITWKYEELKRKNTPKETITKEIWEKHHFGL